MGGGEVASRAIPRIYDLIVALNHSISSGRVCAPSGSSRKSGGQQDLCTYTQHLICIYIYIYI